MCKNISLLKPTPKFWHRVAKSCSKFTARVFWLTVLTVIPTVREVGEDSLQRETVDFSDLLENSEEREEDKRRK